MKAKKLFPELTFKRLWNKITGVENKVDELKTPFRFTNHPANLGLSEGCSALDIVKKLPVDTILLFEIVYNSAWIASGMPDGYLNGGLLEIAHIGSRYIIRFTRQNINSIVTPELYLGSVASNNLTEITWKKVSVT